jgi:RNA polymerase sigma factor (sigma-70 family)
LVQLTALWTTIRASGELEDIIMTPNSKPSEEKQGFPDFDRTSKAIGGVVAIYLASVVAENDAAAVKKLDKLLVAVSHLSSIRHLMARWLKKISALPDARFEEIVTNILAAAATAQANLTEPAPEAGVATPVQSPHDLAVKHLAALGRNDDLAACSQEYRRIITDQLLKPLAKGQSVDFGCLAEMLGDNLKTNVAMIRKLLLSWGGQEFLDAFLKAVTRLAAEQRSSASARAATEMMLDQAGLPHDKPALDEAVKAIGHHARNTFGPKSKAGSRYFVPPEHHLDYGSGDKWSEEEQIAIIGAFEALKRRIDSDPAEVMTAIFNGKLKGQILVSEHSVLVDEVRKQTAAKRWPKDPADRPLRLEVLLAREMSQGEGLDFGDDEETDQVTTIGTYDDETETRCMLTEALESYRQHLTPREFEAAQLRGVDGYSGAETADKMGITEARVSALYKGALAKIRRRHGNVAKPLPKKPKS